jgi:hypothetical protein
MIGCAPPRTHFADNVSTLAVLPIAEFLGSDGMLAKLRAKGFEVVEP